MEEVRIMKSQYAAGRTVKAQAIKDPRSRLSMVKDCLVLRSSRKVREYTSQCCLQLAIVSGKHFLALAGYYPDVIVLCCCKRRVL